MASVNIDGQAIDFEPGESVIQAAVRKDIEIPFYCWHPRLSVAANCRMCLVEVEKAPKLVPACQTECKDGMVVYTNNAKVKAAQKAVHEFLLINHPIDCPICDQAGECKLQDYYMKFQLAQSRMRDVKVGKPKLQRLGPHVVYNAERCIVCTRCIRFMEEVPKVRQLGVFNRGDHSVIGTYPGQELNNAYSLNTVDVCPVGALTSTVFRFKQRVWNLRRSPSVCGGCARGCNVHVDQRSAQVYRLLPRENEQVNKSWLCDEGRLTYNRANEHRLQSALVRVGDKPAVPVEAKEALARAAAALQPLAEHGVAVAMSLHATCEAAYVIGRFAKEVCKQSEVALLGYADGAADTLLRVADKNPNRAGIAKVLADLGLRSVTQRDFLQRLQQKDVRACVCVGSEAHDLDALGAAAKGIEVFVHIAAQHSPLAEHASVTLPGLSAVQVQGTWVNCDGRAQKLVPAFAGQGAQKGSEQWVMALADALGHKDLTAPSTASIQASMHDTLKSFAQVSLGALPPTGQPLQAQEA